jgi:hypothetical protein
MLPGGFLWQYRMKQGVSYMLGKQEEVVLE